MSHAKLACSLARAAAEAGETATHCGVTISARLPMLANAFFAPSASATAEWNRAYAEKVAATWEGAFAAAAEWQAVMLRSAVRPPSLAGFANDLVGVMNEAARPARRKVKANARRFSGTRTG